MKLTKAQQKEWEIQAEHLDEARNFFESLRDEKQSEFDEKSERWQESVKGSSFSEDIEMLDALASVVSDALDTANSFDIE